MNFVFLMDPLEKVIFQKDSTFILMMGAHAKGHKVFYLPSGGMSKLNDSFRFHVKEVIPQLDEDAPFKIVKDIVLTEKDIQALFIRTDPPFNEEYLLNTWMISLLPSSIVVMNSGHGIRTVNEKIWGSQFIECIPPTLIGRNRNDMIEFIHTHKEVIVKPTDGFGGAGVFKLNQDDTNVFVTLETLSQQWQKDIILQKYIVDAQKGDKRILLLDGEPLGAVLRVHSKGDHRNNFYAGGHEERVEITKRDLEIIAIIKPKLKELGLSFVGIDILGDYLVEINVTSPTCLQEMNRLYGVQLEDKVINFVEQNIHKLRP